MAIGQFQGFDKNLNLKESVADRDIINNLANIPIADDIGLFVNNNRNKDSLTVTADNINGSTASFTSDTPFVYTTGTEVTLNVDDSTLEGKFTVVNASLNPFTGDSSFELEDENGDIVTPLPPGDYIRSNKITNQNLNLLRPILSRPVGDAADSFFEDIQNFDGINPYNSFSLVNNLLNSLQDVPIKSLEVASNSLSQLYAQYVNGLFSVEDFNTQREVSAISPFQVTDPDIVNLPDQELSSEGPGIYIKNVIDQEIRRIFSSNDNVWSEDVPNNTLVCASKEIVVGELQFEENIRFSSNDINNIISQETGLANADFSHFIKVKINGEEYSLCLRAQSQ